MSSGARGGGVLYLLAKKKEKTKAFDGVKPGVDFGLPSA